MTISSRTDTQEFFARRPLKNAAPLEQLSIPLRAPAILPSLIGIFLTEFQRVTVSKSPSSDTQFFNSFSLVLGVLVFFAIVLFAYARAVGEETQRKNVLEEPLHLKEVHANVESFAKVAIAGQDNTALAAVTKPAAGSATAVPASGEAAYNQVCQSCHAAGLLGAPKAGDKAAWAPRIALGKDTLYKDAINGKGSMPAKGGTTWPDATVRQAVDYMVSLAK
jgi:cytochrome c5